MDENNNILEVQGLVLMNLQIIYQKKTVFEILITINDMSINIISTKMCFYRQLWRHSSKYFQQIEAYHIDLIQILYQ